MFHISTTLVLIKHRLTWHIALSSKCDEVIININTFNPLTP